MAMPSALLGEGPDPRLVTEEGHGLRASIAYTRPQLRKLHDSEVTWDEYYYYAKKTRAEEDAQPKNDGNEKGFLSMLIPSKSDKGVQQIAVNSSGEHSPSPGDEKQAEANLREAQHEHKGKLNLAKQSDRAIISDEEWTNASRALRTASWGAIFYLITTDILGPFSLPFAFASTGYGPGVALFTVFAGLAIYSGYLLWKMFLDMDSYEFPVKAYGDLGFRLGGWPLRYLFNILQALQLLLNVGLLVVSNGEALSQATKFKFCFAGCCAVWAGVGFLVGQVRTLQKFGFLANAAVWLNVLTMIITMGAAAHTLPNYFTTPISAGAGLNGGVSITPTTVGGKLQYPPVQTTGGLPDPSSFIGSLNGGMSAVFAYGGSMIFPEFMSEMKRPYDFYKGMFGAQIFIYLVYMFYGLFMYHYQGQYTVNPSYLGLSKYGFQLAGNIPAMAAALIAAGLYGNIGVKVLYNNIFVEFFHAPALNTKSGKVAWAALIPIYWAIAFAIGAGIPNFVALTSIVAAFCILHFTYSFPPLMAIIYMIKRDSMLPGEGFDPATGRVVRHDSGLRRYTRGFFSKRAWYLNIFNVVYFLGALALAGLGAYAAIENFIAGFQSGTTNSYVCTSPVDFKQSAAS